MNIPPKGSLLRDLAEMNVHSRRLWRVLVTPMIPVARWLDDQPWVQAFGAWSDRYWPSWLTFWNIMYVGFGLYVALVLFMVWIGA